MLFTRLGAGGAYQGFPKLWMSGKRSGRATCRPISNAAAYTQDLFRQYRRHLGLVRYRVLLESQIMVVPQQVRDLLRLRNTLLLSPLLDMYKLSRSIKADQLLRALILPAKYKQEIGELDQEPN